MDEQDGYASGGPFNAVDPKLTVFALANGMDLEKADGRRRLTWFNDGLERAITIEPATGGGFRLVGSAWKTHAPEPTAEAELAALVTREELTARIEGSIDAVNAL